MRNLILFGPLLWIRHVVFWVLMFLMLLVFVLYLLANSTLATKKVVEAFAPDYNITYESIKGNALWGFEIKNPKYNHKAIAKELTLKWNPNTLAYKKITVNKLQIKELDIDVIKSLVSQFSKDSNTTKEENTTNIPDFTVALEDVSLSTKSFKVGDILVDQAIFNCDSMTYEHNKLNAKKIDLTILGNIAKLSYNGEMKNNQLLGQVVLHPKGALYEQYKIPLRKKAIDKIVVDMNASMTSIVADVHAQAKKILNAKKHAFNIDVDSFDSHVVYDVNHSFLTVKTTARLATPYAKNILITNNLDMKDTLKHQGTIKIAHLKKLKGVDTKFIKLLDNMAIKYKGDAKSIQTTLTSNKIQGYFNSSDFKYADIHLQTLNPLTLSNLVTLPPELKKTKASMMIDVPLNLKDLSSIDAKVKLISNVVNLDSNIRYAKNVTINSKIVIPEKSLVKNYNQDIAWGALGPVNSQISLKGNHLNLILNSKHIKSHLKYGIESSMLDGSLDIVGITLDIHGNSKEKLSIRSKIKSIKTLKEKINKLYHTKEFPPIEGAVDISLLVNKLKASEVTVASSELVYKADRKTKHVLKNIKFVASANEKQLLLKSYELSYKKQKYFSTRVAKVTLGEKISVSNFWVNDALEVKGDYIPELKKGTFWAKAKKYHIQNKAIDIYARVDAQAILDGDDTNINGKVVLLKGSIRPQIEGKSFATDSDIVIIQEMQKHKKSPFMDHLSLMLKIETLKPLSVKQKALHVKLKPDFTITKDKGSKILYLGSIDLIKGGSYIFQKKKFVLKKSAIYFTGDVHKPLLDVKANYQSLNHFITILVTGTPEEPSINFSASPSLSREQILSVLLFDSEGDGDTHSGNEMMRMMGGAMAKAALSDMGVAVDHLAFGEGNSIEVGKKITPKTTVIYINAEIPKVKLKYKHGTHTESVIGVSEESQSYDIVYKRDF